MKFPFQIHQNYSSAQETNLKHTGRSQNILRKSSKTFMSIREHLSLASKFIENSKNNSTYQAFKGSTVSKLSCITLLVIEGLTFLLFIIINSLSLNNQVIYGVLTFSLFFNTFSWFQLILAMRQDRKTDIEIKQHKSIHRFMLSPAVRIFQIFVYISSLATILFISIDHGVSFHVESDDEHLYGMSVICLLFYSTVMQILDNSMSYLVVLFAKLLETTLLISIGVYFNSDILSILLLLIASVLITAIQFVQDRIQRKIFHNMESERTKRTRKVPDKSQAEALNYCISAVGHDLKTPMQVNM